MISNLDTLIDYAVASGQLAAGASPKLVAARSKLGARAVSIIGHASKSATHPNPHWTPDEDAFLVDHLGNLSETEIGAHLGRTKTAVHLRWKRELRLTAPTKRSNELTCEQIAQGLGIDSHSSNILIDRGILAGRVLPFEDRAVRVVERNVFLRWVINPMNWVYFEPAQIGRPPAYLRRAKKFDKKFWQYVKHLVALKRKRWRDEWWSIGKVARYHGVDSSVINRSIRFKKITAIKWGNWWILKSHATDPRVRFYTGKGKPGFTRSDWPAAADAFLLRARKQGITIAGIARMMRKSKNQVEFRWTVLRKGQAGKR